MTSQKGSAHAIIVIGLVILLIGALGFIFWQNFILAKAETKTESSATTKETKKAAEPAVDENEGFLVLEDWGVKFKIPDGIDEITYYKLTVPQNEQDAKEHYEFSTKRVEALGDNCINVNESGSVTRMAYLSRSQTKAEQYASQVPANDNNPIDGYYYMVSGGQSPCSERQAEIQMEARDAISDMLMRPIDLKS